MAMMPINTLKLGMNEAAMIFGLSVHMERADVI